MQPERTLNSEESGKFDESLAQSRSRWNQDLTSSGDREPEQALNDSAAGAAASAMHLIRIQA
jgi:hypothetical protein